MLDEDVRRVTQMNYIKSHLVMHFFRACCNFAFPKPPGRPMITKETDEKDETVEDDDENDLDDYDDVEYKKISVLYHT